MMKNYGITLCHRQLIPHTTSYRKYFPARIRNYSPYEGKLYLYKAQSSRNGATENTREEECGECSF